jgi:ABC-type lipoprotein export system ATPase subunit
MTEALVVGSHVRREYEADGIVTAALAEADFEIRPGDRIALTGPSGSGKTTLLHVIAGLDEPTSGSIEWPGLGPRSGLRPLRVTLAFQGESLLPTLSVAENVALPLILGGAHEKIAAQAAAAVLHRLDLEELANKLPEELSGGQAQRVALARALVVRPALLLADEPTGQQDRSHAEDIVAELLEFAEEAGTAVVVATHDPHVAARLPVHWDLSDGWLATGAG